jgi:hypothetical protein
MNQEVWNAWIMSVGGPSAAIATLIDNGMSDSMAGKLVRGKYPSEPKQMAKRIMSNCGVDLEKLFSLGGSKAKSA